MRGNSKTRKALGGVKVTYEITGLNQDRLIKELVKRDFTLYNVNKKSNRLMYISVSLQQSKNFFAITKNLCYNVKKVKLFGVGLPAYKLVKNLGLAIGALVFLALALLSNDYVFSISYSGSGSVYSRQVDEYLEERGITKFTRFSSFKIDRLEDEILAFSPNLTFVSVAKRGNTLDVYMTLKKQSAGAISGRQKELVSTVSGRVEQVKIYRGTALVGVGDSVNTGDILAVGYIDIKETRVETGVLAYFTLLQEQSFTYRLSGLEMKELALSLAQEELGEKQIINSVVTVSEVSGKQNLFDYTVSLEYRSVIYAE